MSSTVFANSIYGKSQVNVVYVDFFVNFIHKRKQTASVMGTNNKFTTFLVFRSALCSARSSFYSSSSTLMKLCRFCLQNLGFPDGVKV
jgi:hypothetical protein